MTITDKPLCQAEAETKREAMMTERQMRQTAKIYQFPKGGRAALHGQRLVKSADSIVPARRVGHIDFGDCWYHETAIIDDAEMVRWN